MENNNYVLLRGVVRQIFKNSDKLYRIVVGVSDGRYTEFITLTCFINTIKQVDKLAVGDEVKCLASLRNNKYVDKSGKTVYQLQVIANDIQNIAI